MSSPRSHPCAGCAAPALHGREYCCACRRRQQARDAQAAKRTCAVCGKLRRLDDAGRRLNRALSSIALTRMSHDPATRAYVAPRRAEGRTSKEIRRSLKRYIARQLYRRLTTSPAHALVR